MPSGMVASNGNGASSDVTDTEREQVAQAVKMLLETANGRKARDIAEVIHATVSREHRTLQQGFWSALLLAQIKYADNPHDLRNEQAVELAKLVKEVATARHFDLGLMYV